MDLIAIIRRTLKTLDKCVRPEKIYVCSFNESPEWHLHFHLIPRLREEVIIGPELLATRSRRKIVREEVERIVTNLRRELTRT